MVYPKEEKQATNKEQKMSNIYKAEAKRISDNFFEKIREVMEQRGIKQVEIAQGLEMTESNVSHIFARKNTLSLEKILQLCDTIGVDFNTVLRR